MPSANGHGSPRVVCYARVSSQEQVKGYSLAQQLEALRKYAADEGYEVVGEFKDEGWSGASLERPPLRSFRSWRPQYS